MSELKPIVDLLSHAWGVISQTEGYHKQPKIELVSPERACPSCQVEPLSCCGKCNGRGLVGGNRVVLKFVTRGPNEGSVNVSLPGGSPWQVGSVTYAGKVLAGGRFIASRGLKSQRLEKGLVAFLRAFARDPVGQAKASSEVFGACCFCSRALTRNESIGVGYGPTCAERYGLPWGAKHAVEPVTVDERLDRVANEQYEREQEAEVLAACGPFTDAQLAPVLPESAYHRSPLSLGHAGGALEFTYVDDDPDFDRVADGWDRGRAQ